jgi:hemoglobin-like flavoprotein
MGAPAENTSASGALSDAEKTAIKDTWRLIDPIRDTAADLFYRRLFELKPEYRTLFKDNMEAQKRKLVGMLAFIVKSLSWPDSLWREVINPEDDLFLIVLALGRRHRELYKIPVESYETVRDVLLWTMDYGLGEAFTPASRDAWARVYDLVSMTMRMGKGATELGKAMKDQGSHDD